MTGLLLDIAVSLGVVVLWKNPCTVLKIVSSPMSVHSTLGWSWLNNVDMPLLKLFSRFYESSGSFPSISGPISFPETFRS